MSDPDLRRTIRERTVTAVYRHIRADAAGAASAGDWVEYRRLSEIAQRIRKAYPFIAARARFSEKLD